ncbi:hypothetical protein RCC94_09920 [Exiguobacterium acetylicum]|uniref:hypothetical protein n=1 Tax=Exiguobacterium TaxID=33986 RepID=UPI000EC8AD8E|nr:MULTISPECIES: hypothetical protein [Exiguobacterium]MDQ6467805.1 hypothetical protein [Exiguobacterium acetylicum]HAB34120.1 hypothetical protein [Exiguobacterium sp.]
MKRVLLCLPLCLLMACSPETSRIQEQLEQQTYTRAVERSEQDIDEPAAQLMVQLERQLAGYQLRDVLKTAEAIERLQLTTDHPVRKRAEAIALSAKEMLKQVKQFEGTYEVERSILEDEPFDGTGRIHVSFDEQDTFIAMIRFEQFGLPDALRNDEEIIRFEPDFSARINLSEGQVSYRFARSTLRVTFEGPSGKRIYQLKQLSKK